MGIQDRKKRQMAEREDFFLDRAGAMIERDGLLALQMAKLAEECEYSVGTLYQHFTSKEDLLVALATRSAQDRVAIFERAARWPGSNRERLLALVIADIIIAQRSPEQFQLFQYVSTQTIWSAASPERRQCALANFQPVIDLFEQISTDAINAGDVQAFNLSGQELCGGIQAMLVGIHSFVNATGIIEAQSVDHPYRLLLRQIHALLNGWGWQPLMPLDDLEQQNQLIKRIVATVFPEHSSVDCNGVVNP